MIIERYTITEFSGLFSGTAAITITPVTEISFKNLASDKAKMKALEIGFSPAVSFELLDGVWNVIEGETAKAIIAVHIKEDFWNYRP